jgi:hypothetical protein
MSTASMDSVSATATPSASQPEPVTTDTILLQLRGLLREIFDPYRPELHYMRGPGPAWRAKHADQPAALEPHTGEQLAASAS